MHPLEGNPFINWKYLDITFEGATYRARVRAFECTLCNNNIAYHVKYRDKEFVFGHIGEKWHQINNPTEFAQIAGKAIDTRVQKVMSQFFEDNRPRKIKKWDIGLNWSEKGED